MARTIHYSDETYNPNLYYRLVNGTLIELVPNSIQGLTNEIITVIRETVEEEHASDLNERYIEDSRFAKLKEMQEAFEDPENDDGIPRIGGSLIVEENLRYSPEYVLFKEKKKEMSVHDMVKEVIPELTESQQKLYRNISDGLSLQMIADKENTTKNAIASRKRKMVKRLAAKYKKKFE